MDFPDNLFYTKDHEWIRYENGFACIGITDYAQKELGEIVYVDVTTVGEKVDQNAIFGSIEAVKTVSDLFLPVSGEITEVNPELDDKPELVNEDPYGKGWIIKIVPANQDSKEGLLDASGYKKLIGY